MTAELAVGNLSHPRQHTAAAVHLDAVGVVHMCYQQLVVRKLVAAAAVMVAAAVRKLSVVEWSCTQLCWCHRPAETALAHHLVDKKQPAATDEKESHKVHGKITLRGS